MKNQTILQKISYTAAIIFVIITLTACSSNLQSGNQNNGIQPLAGGASGGDPQLEITKGAPNNANASGGGDNSVISSDGTKQENPGGNAPSAPGTIAGSQGGSDNSGVITSPDVKFLTYKDARYGFTISYPETFVILPEIDKIEQGPVPDDRVRFQIKELSQGDAAALEPPQFTIEMYKISSPVDLKSWLSSKTLLPGNAKADAISLAGARQGLVVTLNIMLSPNQFYYYATDSVIYRLIPAGQYSQDMLKSFKLQ